MWKKQFCLNNRSLITVSNISGVPSSHTHPGMGGGQIESKASHERIPSCFPANCLSAGIVWNRCQKPFISTTGGSPCSWTYARQLDFSFQAQPGKTHEAAAESSNLATVKTKSWAGNGRFWPITSKLSHLFSVGSCHAKEKKSNQHISI